MIRCTLNFFFFCLLCCVLHFVYIPYFPTTSYLQPYLALMSLPDERDNAVDLDALPEMEDVKGDFDADANTSTDTSGTNDTSHDSTFDTSRPESMPAARRGSESSSSTPGRPITSQQSRRGRGLSFLPVRPLGAPSQLPVSSPPKTPSPLKPLDGDSNLSSHSFGSSPVAASSLSAPPRAHSSATVSAELPSHINGSATSVPARKTVAPTVDDNQRLLSTYFSQLASKEAHIGSLRSTIEGLQQELKEAEADMRVFQQNGSKLAKFVNDQHDFTTLKQRPRSVSSSSTGSHPSSEDVLGAGRRIVADINTQFWSFLDDVKSATIGNAEFDARPPPDLPRRSPSPRRLNPKKSIQDFVRARSPTRSPRPPSPSKQERIEHAANHELRSSVRLSRKLSHIDLRGPHARTDE